MWLPFRRKSVGPDAHLAPLHPAAARYAVIDTELTGLDPRRDSIVSLGALRVAGGRIDLADRFYEEARPASALTAASIVLHGITPQEVRDRRMIGGVLEDFAAFRGADILVGHFIEIDLDFLRRELAQAGLAAIANPALDTWPLYDWMSSRKPASGEGLPRLKDPRLPELAGALGVPSHGEHNALSDAFVTAQVFQRLLRRLDRWGITTTGQLLRIADPRRATRWPREDTAPLA
jgi:DNA polymerase-3 subunit epsilon